MFSQEVQDLLTLCCPQHLYNLPRRDRNLLVSHRARGAEVWGETKGRVNASERGTGMDGSRHLREKGRPSG